MIPMLDVPSYTEQAEFLLNLQIIVNALVIAENKRNGFMADADEAKPEGPKKAPLILMP